MASGRDEKARQAQEELGNLRRRLEELETLFHHLGREEEPQERDPQENSWKPRWYHSRWLEPALGILLGIIILVSLNAFLGNTIVGALRTIEDRLTGGDLPNTSVSNNSMLYLRNCAGCHGEKGEKTSSGQTLKQYLSRWGEQAMSRIIRDGKGSMPALGKVQGGVLSDEEIEKIIQVILSIDGRQVPTLPVETTRQGVVPSVNAALSGIVKHDADWNQKHGKYAIDSGSNVCFRCHQQESCAACHTRSY